jgi:hypothetical protein
MSVGCSKITILTYPKGKINMTTTNWKNFPFVVDGINFNSRIDINSSTGKRASQVPVEVLQNMNIGAVRELIGDVKTMSNDELVAKLAYVNEGNSWAVIELV